MTARYWKKFRSSLCAESGSVAVVVALCLTVLIGCTAFAVDFGMLATGKQKLQNAADAAALAGAADLAEQKPALTVEQSIREYCAANACPLDSEDYEMSYVISGSTLTVNLRRKMAMGFSAVITGQYTRSVSASATAEAVTIFGSCPYAMFAGRKIEDDGSGITMSGNNIQINGNIHSNSDISMPNAVLAPGAVATAVRHVRPSSAGWSGNSIAMDMPSFSSFEKGLNKKSDVVVFPGNVVKNAKDGFASLLRDAEEQYFSAYGTRDYLTDGLTIHICGNLTFNGNASSAYTASYPITLIADGDLTLNGASLDSTEEFPAAIMSKSRDITVNGGGATYTGILFAPEGQITINGNDANFVGRIVAQDIRKAGGKITVTYYEDSDRFLPVTKVHLTA